ncbi:hypothetical protein [Alkalihalobacterium sp. APHAB7]
MAKKKRGRNEAEITNNASDAEFGIEYIESKKSKVKKDKKK